MWKWLAAVATIASDVRHGALLKAFALVSRGVFLIFVAPLLPPGELSTYVFLISIAVLAARVLTLGLDEQLPLEIGGKKSRLETVMPTLIAALLLNAGLILIMLIATSTVSVVAVLIVSYATTSYMAGAIRTISVESSERLRDLHWPFFVLLLIILPAEWTAIRLIQALIGSILVIQLMEVGTLRRLGMRLRISAFLDPVRRQLAEHVAVSWKKLLAGATTLAIVRGAVLWPETLGGIENLDFIAYSLLIGEAFWQTAMVIVYRRYALYCGDSLDRSQIANDALRTVFVILVYGALVGTVAAVVGTAFDIQIGRFDSWEQVGLMIYFFAFFSSYLLLRYVAWVLTDFDWALVSAEVLIFLFQGVVVWALPSDLWIPFFVGLSVLLTCSAAARLFTAPSYRRMIRPSEG